MKKGLLVVIGILTCQLLLAGTPKVKRWKGWLFKQQMTDENPRVVASVLCIAVGPFGGHRLYLGTDEKVPVAYTLTLGGGLGILPIIDLGHIIFSKDLSKYRGNKKVIMWLQ
jgi:hypothetical protein